jgi:hypothetical protein
MCVSQTLSLPITLTPLPYHCIQVLLQDGLESVKELQALLHPVGRKYVLQ